MKDPGLPRAPTSRLLQRVVVVFPNLLQRNVVVYPKITALFGKKKLPDKEQPRLSQYKLW